MTEMIIAFALLAVAGLTITTMVRNSGQGANEQVNVAKRNAEMRNAVEAISQELAEADKPLIAAPLLDASAPKANEVIFARTEEQTDGRTFTAVRVFVQGTDLKMQRLTLTANTEYATAGVKDVIDNRISDAFLAAASNPAHAMWATTARTKTLVSGISVDATEPVFTFYSRAGRLATVSGGALNGTLASRASNQKITLVDLTVRVDTDGAGPSKPSTLRNSVYLRKVTSTSPGSGRPINC